LLDERDEFFAATTLTSGEVDQLVNFEHQGASFLGTGDTYTSTAGEVDGPLISKYSQRSKDSVSIDAKYRREVNRWGESFTGPNLTVCDCLSDFRCDLIVQGELL
jgi:hypothetical protein